MKFITSALVLVACVAVAQAAPVLDAQNVQSGTECLICQFLTKELDKFLLEPSTEGKIVAGIEDVCHLLPSSVQDSCKSFIEAEGDSLVQWIVGELSAQNVCDDILNLHCDGGVMSQLLQEDQSHSLKSKGASCAICKDVVGAIKQALEDPSNINAITSDVESFCHSLGALSGLCKDLLASWTPKVLQWLDGKLVPQTVCAAIDVCSAPALVEGKVLLGAKMCTRGPAYWCSSMDAARECGEHAVKFCEDNMW